MSIVNAIALNVVKLNVTMLNGIILNVTMLSAIMLNVMEPAKELIDEKKK